MTILVYDNALPVDQPIARFMRNCLARLIKIYPNWKLILVVGSNRSGGPEWTEPGFEQVRLARPAIPILGPLIFRQNLTSLVKKQKVDIVLIINGKPFSASIPPQFIFLPAQLPEKSVRTALRKGVHYLSLASEITKEWISRGILETHQIKQINYCAPAVYQPLSATQKQEIRNGHTNGQEYFLYAGSLMTGPKLMALLKAFSVFKKWQASSWKLLLVGPSADGGEELKAALLNYKYRSDVLVFSDPPIDLEARLFGAAYALIQPGQQQCSPYPAVESLACQVPLLTPVSSWLYRQAGAAALGYDDEEFRDLGEKMKLLYRDEQLRYAMAQQAAAKSLEFSMDAALSSLLQLLHE